MRVGGTSSSSGKKEAHDAASRQHATLATLQGVQHEGSLKNCCCPDEASAALCIWLGMGMREPREGMKQKGEEAKEGRKAHDRVALLALAPPAKKHRRLEWDVG